MLTRLRRFTGVLLALALLPAAGGAAQCMDHGETVAAEGSVSSAPAGAHDHGTHHGSAGDAATVADSPATSHVAADNCCPPPGAPGECSSAMGCSAMSAAPVHRELSPLQPITRVIVADGAQLSPGPSPAPEIPPPRS